MNYANLSEKSRRLIEKINKQKKDDRFIMFGFERYLHYDINDIFAYTTRFCFKREDGDLHGKLAFFYNHHGLFAVKTEEVLTEEEMEYMKGSFQTTDRYKEMIDSHTNFFKDLRILIKSEKWEIKNIKEISRNKKKEQRGYTFEVWVEERKFDCFAEIEGKSHKCTCFSISQEKDECYDCAFETFEMIKEHKNSLYQDFFNRIRLELITE
jgi:hypothetical protein